MRKVGNARIQEGVTMGVKRICNDEWRDEEVPAKHLFTLIAEKYYNP